MNNQKVDDNHRSTNYHAHGKTDEILNLIRDDLDNDPELVALVQHLRTLLVTKNHRKAIALKPNTLFFINQCGKHFLSKTEEENALKDFFRRNGTWSGCHKPDWAEEFEKQVLEETK